MKLNFDNLKTNNSFWLAFQFSFSVLVAFITLKLNIDYFGNELFGIWLLFASIWGVGSVVDLGFGTSIIKFVSQANRDNDYDEISIIASTGIVLFIIIGSFFLVLGNIFSSTFVLSNRNIIPLSYVDISKHILFILGINFFFQYISIFFKSIFEGLNNFAFSSKLQLTYNVLILGSVITTILFKYDIVILSILYSLSSFFLFFLYLYFFIKKHSIIKLSLLYVNFNKIREILHFSFSVQLAVIFGVLIDPVIKFIIGNYSSVSFITFYEVARKFAIAISGLFYATFKTLLPQASILRNKEEYQSFLNTTGKQIGIFGINYSSFIFGFLSIFFAIIIKQWYGYDESIIIFLILALPESINNFGYFNYIFLLGIGKAKFLAIIQFINLVLICSSVILGFIWLNSSLGLISYFISVAIVNIMMLIYTSNVVKIKIFEFLNEIKIIQLLLLDFLILVSIFLIFYKVINIYLVLIILSIISLLSFYKGYKIILNKLLLNNIFKK